MSIETVISSYSKCNGSLSSVSLRTRKPELSIQIPQIFASNCASLIGRVSKFCHAYLTDLIANSSNPTKPCLILQVGLLISVALCIDYVREVVLPHIVQGVTAGVTTFGSGAVFTILSLKGLYDSLKAYQYAVSIGDEKGKLLAFLKIALNSISLGGSLLLLVTEVNKFTSLSAHFLTACATTIASLFGVWYLMAIAMECQKLYRAYQLKQHLMNPDFEAAWNHLEHLYAPPEESLNQDVPSGWSTQVVKGLQVAEQDCKRYMPQECFNRIKDALEREDQLTPQEKQALIKNTISQLNKQQIYSVINILGNLVSVAGMIVGQVGSCGTVSLGLLVGGGVVTFLAGTMADKGKQPRAETSFASPHVQKIIQLVKSQALG